MINTGTTIVTFLMVFLIQNTQNRDTQALQLKLDELIIATKGARNSITAIEDATDDQLETAKEDVRARANGEPKKAKSEGERDEPRDECCAPHRPANHPSRKCP